jgi:hypothetical protein
LEILYGFGQIGIGRNGRDFPIIIFVRNSERGGMKGKALFNLEERAGVVESMVNSVLK